MTKVRFTFVDVQGNPLPGMEFKLLLRRASFNIEDVGVTLPEELVVTTDEQGKALVDLWPLKAAYRIQIAEEFEEICGKLNWSFYVPHSTEIIEAQTLFLVPPPTNVPWDEAALAKITQAVQDTHNDAVSALDSAKRAEIGATTAVASADTAVKAATAANASQQATAQYEASARTSAGTATTKAAEATASATAAKASETSATASKTSATASATAAAGSAAEAKAEKVAAGNSATASAASAAEAKAEKVAAGNSATAAAGSASTALTQAGVATTQAGTATTQADRAKTEADRATAATDGKQPLNANLTGLSLLTSANDRLPFFNGGGGGMGLAVFPAQGRTLVAQTTVAAQRTALGLSTGAITNVQTLPKAISGELLRADMNGIGLQRDLRNTAYLTGTPRDILSSGTTIGFGDAGVLGIPGYTPGNYGVLHSNIHFSDPSGAGAMSQTFEFHTETWRRQMSSLDTWNTWVLVGGRTQYITNSNGEAWLYPDGAMTAVATLDGGTFSIQVPTYRTWTYPRVFVGTVPKVIVSMDRPSVDVTMLTARTAFPGLASVQMAHSQTAQAGCSFICLAVGRWK